MLIFLSQINTNIIPPVGRFLVFIIIDIHYVHRHGRPASHAYKKIYFFDRGGTRATPIHHAPLPINATAFTDESIRRNISSQIGDLFGRQLRGRSPSTNNIDLPNQFQRCLHEYILNNLGPVRTTFDIVMCCRCHRRTSHDRRVYSF